MRSFPMRGGTIHECCLRSMEEKYFRVPYGHYAEKLDAFRHDRQHVARSFEKRRPRTRILCSHLITLSGTFLLHSSLFCRAHRNSVYRFLSLSSRE